VTHFTDYFRKKAGLCRHGEESRKTRPCAVPENSCQFPPQPTPVPGDFSPSSTNSRELRPGYQENILLILLLLAGLFCLVDLKMLAVAGVFSALLVYYDAGTIHAGEKFAKETILGDVVTWRPLTWALAVLIIPLIFLAIYVFSRKEIFEANC
jgi:hypothetical protein